MAVGLCLLAGPEGYIQPHGFAADKVGIASINFFTNDIRVFQFQCLYYVLKDSSLSFALIVAFEALTIGVWGLWGSPLGVKRVEIPSQARAPWRCPVGLRARLASECHGSTCHDYAPYTHNK